MIENLASVRIAFSAPPGWLKDAAVLLFVLTAVFGFDLGSRALWNPDEGRYAEIPREMVITGDYVTPRLNGVKYLEKPPLFYWLQAGAIKLFGLNEWSLRFWGALFAVLGCLAVYAAGRGLYGRQSGLFSAAALATAPLYYFMSRIVNPDMTVSVLLTISLLAFLFGVREFPERVRRGYLTVFYLCAGLATMTKGLIGIVIPGAIIGVWIMLLGEWRLLRRIYLPSGLAIFLLIAAPWHILVARANPEFLQFYFIHEHFQRYLTTVHHRYEPVWFFVPVLLGGFLPWTMFIVQALRDALSWKRVDFHRDREALFLIVWAAVVFLFFSLSRSKLVPYVLPAVPPLALLIGRYLARSTAAVGRRASETALAAVLAGATVTAIAAVIISLPAATSGQIGPYLHRIEDYGVIWVVTFGALAVLMWGLFRLMPRTASLTALAVFSGFALSATAAVLPKFDNHRSTKELALRLKPRLSAHDEVMSYHTYYQDLPVYLGRRITVVDWEGELAFGLRQEDTQSWMINEKTFIERWQGSNRAYLFTDPRSLDHLRAEGVPLRVLAQTERTVLVTNGVSNP